jgi:hypothetical protein
VGFRVDDRGAGLGVKPALFQGTSDGNIHSDNVRVNGVRERLEQSTCPRFIRRNTLLAGPDTGPDDPVAGNEIGRQSAGDAKADDAGSTSLERRLEGDDELRGLLADHRHSRAQGDTRLQRKRGNGDYVAFTRHPTAP